MSATRRLAALSTPGAVDSGPKGSLSSMTCTARMGCPRRWDSRSAQSSAPLFRQDGSIPTKMFGRSFIVVSSLRVVAFSATDLVL
ncbi:hypothetical protein EV644_15514 [Kribbella orskensis]|uniref:Uncharacterized protein n=1 Tax=Kribbella orskensis TaxID=2512216 RepID=A0ABY2B608_9ACTN|nr:hypothetical protein EV642_15814 [Kribbella sp. VKM Ac-2500]TCO07577.1 hypothetical protein EV644_15514 [Kribbella orskensis]